MRDYSPKRRTAVVFTGTGTSGAYHAGVLRALDESGVKIDLVVGSGVGAVSAAFAAVVGGRVALRRGGLLGRRELALVLPAAAPLRAALLLLAVSFGVFALPVLLGLLLGLLFPLLLLADRVFAGTASRALSVALGRARGAERPLPGRAGGAGAWRSRSWRSSCSGALYWRRRTRFAEAFEALLDAEPGLARLKRGLWEVARGPQLTGAPSSEAELGRRYVALLAENLGQPGFRELILRAADLDRGRALGLHAAPGGRARGPATARTTSSTCARPSKDALFFDALATGLLLPVALPLRRVAFPRGAVHAGETHRLTDATLVAGCGIAEAIDAGAEQVVVVTGVPEEPPAAAAPPRPARARRRHAARARAAGRRRRSRRPSAPTGW